MAQIIDLKNQKIKQFGSPRTRKEAARKMEKQVFYFNELLKKSLKDQFTINQFQSDQTQCRIKAVMKETIFQGQIHQEIFVNYERGQLKMVAYFYKSSYFLTIGSKQKRINTYRPLLKIQNFSHLNFFVNPHNGFIGTHALVRLSTEIDFRFTLKQIIRNTHFLQENILILLTYCNEIPSQITKKNYLIDRFKFVNFKMNEQLEEKKLQKYLFRSVDKLQFSETNDDQCEIHIQDQKQKYLHISSKSTLQSLLLFKHASTSRKQLSAYSIKEEQTNLLIQNFKVYSLGVLNKGENKFIFNYCQIMDQKNVKVRETNFRNPKNRILFSQVKLKYLINGLRQKVGKQFSIKYVGIKQPLSKESKTRAEQEVKILEKFQYDTCPFLLKYYISKQETFPYKNNLMMDFLLEGLPFYKFLSKNSQTLSISTKLLLFSKVAKALFFVHGKGIVHMDVSQSNIIIIKSTVKLIDFGESIDTNSPDPNYLPGYTFPFTPPQRFQDKKYTQKYDIYSLMVLLYKSIFQTYPNNHWENLASDLKNRRYRQKVFLCPEGLTSNGYEKVIDYILKIIIRGFSEDKETRPHSSWVILLMKELFYWLEEYISFFFILRSQ